MSTNSVNTNNAALVALQSLNRTTSQLDATQKRVSTGLRVADARDDGGAFAVAQKVRGDMAGLTSSNEQLGATKGLLDTTLSGVNRISDTLAQVRSVVVKLADNAVSGTLRASYEEQFEQLRTQIGRFVNDSVYNGVSLIGQSQAGGATNASSGTSFNVVRNESGSTFTIAGLSLTAAYDPDGSGPGASVERHRFDLRSAADINSLASDAFAAATPAQQAAGLDSFKAAQWKLTIDDSATLEGQLKYVEREVNAALNRFGNANKQVDNQISFNKDKLDALESGLGALIDADLAKEAARLQSLQIRQQLGATALTTANQAPQILASLFR